MSDTDIRRRFHEMVATQPDVLVKGKASTYTSMNGNMFAFVTREGAIALRLGDEDRAAFMKRHKTGPVVQYGAVMRGYVEVPAGLAKRREELARYFAASVAHARTLAAKPTTRKPTTGRKTTGKPTTGKKTTRGNAARKPSTRKPATRKRVVKK